MEDVYEGHESESSSSKTKVIDQELAEIIK